MSGRIDRQKAAQRVTRPKACKVMSEIDRTQAAIERCEAKLAAARDELSRYYYRQCLVGHRAWLAKLCKTS